MELKDLLFNLEGDAVLDKYAITVNDSLLDFGFIRNTSAVIRVNLSDLLKSEGVYSLILLVSDSDGHLVSYELTIVVEKSTPPNIISVRKYLEEFELGMDPGVIIWLLNESFPENYTVYINNSVILSGNYKNWENITIPLKTYILEPGTYNITIMVMDKAENLNSSTVIIKAYPSESPIITKQPTNVTIEVNESITLTWTAEDRFPSKYVIYVNGTKVQSGDWLSNQNITYDFKATKTGVYEITIILKDKAGNEAKSTIYIKVQSTSQQRTTQPTGVEINLGTLSVGISVALIALVALLYYLRKIKK